MNQNFCVNVGEGGKECMCYYLINSQVSEIHHTELWAKVILFRSYRVLSCGTCAWFPSIMPQQGSCDYGTSHPTPWRATSLLQKLHFLGYKMAGANLASGNPEPSQAEKTYLVPISEQYCQMTYGCDRACVGEQWPYFRP